MITYKIQIIPERQAIYELYNDVQWSLYTADMDKLMVAIAQSRLVITAWDTERLVGLLRAVGDGETIVYIQDILVLKDYQRQGIGRRLMEQALEQCKDIRQKVLLTDDTRKTRAFYQSIGFKACDDLKLVSFAKLE